MGKILIFVVLTLFLLGCSKQDIGPETKLAGNAVIDTKGPTTCEDSDNGIKEGTAGKITGETDGEDYLLYDKCIGDTNILVEYHCENNNPVNQNIRCTTKKGCLAGACR